MRVRKHAYSEFRPRRSCVAPRLRRTHGSSSRVIDNGIGGFGGRNTRKTGVLGELWWHRVWNHRHGAGPCDNWDADTERTFPHLDESDTTASSGGKGPNECGGGGRVEDVGER